jgi:hypothetical protein
VLTVPVLRQLLQHGVLQIAHTSGAALSNS